mgnify:CR=1 FL=1
MMTQSAQAGREWIRQGFHIFMQQPFELLLLLISLFFFKLIFSFIPYLGEVLPFIIAPVLGMGYMNAAREVAADRKFKIGILLSAFRVPQVRPLCILGFLYVIAFFVALACSISFDQGALWDHALGIKQLDMKTLEKSGVGSSAFITMLVFMPIALALWFSAPLILWQNMSVMKSIFYSAIAVWRSKLAFVVYLFSWIAILFFTMFVYGVVASLIPALSGILQTFVLIPIMIAMSVVMQCSFYTSYISIFHITTPQIDEVV